MTHITRRQRFMLYVTRAVNWAIFLALLAMVAGYLTGCGGGAPDDPPDLVVAPCYVKQGTDEHPSYRECDK